MKRQHGFTLIEVMVALLILAFLSIFTSQAIQRALANKTKIQRDIDKNATVRDALRVIERDVNMAFNFRDASIKLYNQAQDERKRVAQQLQNPGTSTNPPPNPPIQPPIQIDETKYKHKSDKVWTKFIGDRESMSFTSLSNVRMTEDAPISSQAEIGYRLKSCRRRSTQEQSSQCLWRRVSNYIHEDITKYGEETVLLENVTEFKLRYLGPGKDGEWQEAWSTETSGDDVTKGKFPWAVEVTIAINDTTSTTKDKTLRMTSVASIRNPNNEKPKPAQDGANAPIPTR